jgi:hypothetical protein
MLGLSLSLRITKDIKKNVIVIYTWILSTGFWVDSATKWKDEETWID